ALAATCGASRPGLSLRRTLPVDLLVRPRSEAGSSNASLCAAALRQAADELEGKGSSSGSRSRGLTSLVKKAVGFGGQRQGQGWVEAATDVLATDFFTNRLPPPKELLSSWSKGPR
ncbi:unnamed protein product, partial [Polarella glacialis]